MEIRLTAHARRRMALRRISRGEIEEAIAAPDDVYLEESAVEYFKIIDARSIRVVVARGSEPPLVITVMVVAEGSA